MVAIGIVGVAIVLSGYRVDLGLVSRNSSLTQLRSLSAPGSRPTGQTAAFGHNAIEGACAGRVTCMQHIQHARWPPRQRPMHTRIVRRAVAKRLSPKEPTPLAVLTSFYIVFRVFTTPWKHETKRNQ
jgi:hypothetical protein